MAPDMPGYGGTLVPAGPFSTQDLLDALLAGLGVRGLVVVSPLLDRFAGTPAIASFVEAEEELLAAGQPQAAECSFDAGDRAAELDLPVLVVCGSLDHDCVRQSAEYLAARVRGATLWIAEGAAHLPTVELPGQFDARVFDFMAGRQHR